MIAELAAANAAFAIIKKTISNGGDIFAAGQSLFSYFDNKSAIQRKVSQGGKSALEEFAALEQLKSQEDELKRIMIYHGRAGMWDDWLSFQVEAKKKRAEAERAEIRKAEYPPVADYIDGLVKGDQAQMDAYVAACQAVKIKYPKE